MESLSLWKYLLFYRMSFVGALIRDKPRSRER
jgi:hypothetical protein